MRRAPIVITTTIAGVAGVLAFQPHAPELPAVALASAGAAPDASTGAATTTPGSAATGGTTPTPGSSASGSVAATTATPAAKTATGSLVATRYGTSQVRVTVSGGKITNVTALKLTGDDPKSAQISASAEPLLRASVLAKQTAAIDSVSGATITSASYEASLQSALDQVGFKASDGTRGSSTIPNVDEHGGGPGGFPGN